VTRPGEGGIERERDGREWEGGREALTDLQILGCELHRNAFGGRPDPLAAGGAIALPQTPQSLLSDAAGMGMGTKRVGNKEGKRKLVEGEGGS